MSFGLTPGQSTSGPSADGNKALISAVYALPAGFIVRKGQVFCRNLYTVVGSNYRYPQYSGADTCVLPGSVLAGPIMGVYEGLPIVNSSSVTQNVIVSLRREGIAPTLVGAVNGGAIAIGSGLGFATSTVIGSRTLDVPTQNSFALGNFCGYAVAQNINTVLANPVSPGSQTVAVANTKSITAGTVLTVDYGTQNAETVTVTSSAYQTKANANIVVGVAAGGTAGAGNVLTVTVNGVTATYTTTAADTTAALTAQSLLTAIRNSAICQGSGAVIATPVLSGSTIYLTALGSNPGNNSVSLSATSSNPLTGITLSASNSNLGSGAYGTITASFQKYHPANAVVIGQQNSATGIITAPSANLLDVNLILVDLQISSAG